MIILQRSEGWVGKLGGALFLMVLSAVAFSIGSAVMVGLGVVGVLVAVWSGATAVVLPRRPRRLEVESESFSVAVPFRRMRRRYAECSEFTVTRFGGGNGRDAVAYRWNRRPLGSMPRYLPWASTWQPADVAGLLNERRKAVLSNLG